MQLVIATVRLQLLLTLPMAVVPKSFPFWIGKNPPSSQKT
jgi:hypothetical protein